MDDGAPGGPTRPPQCWTSADAHPSISELRRFARGNHLLM